MTKLRFSSGMHLYIIISAVLIAAGLIVGLAMHFVSGSFFNWGADYSGYKAVEISYSAFDIAEDEVMKTSEDAFAENGVSYYTFVTFGDSTNSRIEYRFGVDADMEKLQAAAATINGAVGMESDSTGFAAARDMTNIVRNSSQDLTYAGIAVATAVVFQFIYFAIRYKLTMAAAGVLANVHNLALFLALLALTRVQVGSVVIALSALVSVLTIICTGIIFDRMRKLFRTDDYKAMNSLAQTDAAARAVFPLSTLVCGMVFVAAVLLLIFALIAGGTVYGLFMPAVAMLIAVVCVWYGSIFFTVSVYSRLKQIADRRIAARAVKYVGAKQAIK